MDVCVIEKNGRPVPPAFLEIGMYDDDLAARSIRPIKISGSLGFDGLNAGNYLEATLAASTPKAAKYAPDAAWKPIIDVLLIDGGTLRDTGERAPPLPQPVAEPPAVAAKRSDGWFQRGLALAGIKTART